MSASVLRLDLINHPTISDTTPKWITKIEETELSGAIKRIASDE